MRYFVFIKYHYKYKIHMSEQYDGVLERLIAVEEEMKLMKMGEVVKGKVVKDKVKKTRAPSAYNSFVSKYMNEQKMQLGDDYKHKIAFSGAAKSWNEQKNTTSPEKNTKSPEKTTKSPEKTTKSPEKTKTK